MGAPLGTITWKPSRATISRAKLLRFSAVAIRRAMVTTSAMALRSFTTLLLLQVQRWWVTLTRMATIFLSPKASATESSLACHVTNEGDQSEARIASWVEQLKAEGMPF